MAERDKIRAFRRPALAGWLALVAALVPGTSAAAAQTTLQVEASNGLPGFHRGELQRYLVLHMAEVGLGDWRFEPAAEGASACDRVSHLGTADAVHISRAIKGSPQLIIFYQIGYW